MSQPVKVFNENLDSMDGPPPVDLIVVGNSPDDDDLERHVRSRELASMARFEAEDAYVTIYDASPARARMP